MKKSILIAVVLIVAVGTGLLTARFFWGGDEDAWLCQNGEWVKHGNPLNSAPVEVCDGNFIEDIDNELEKTNLIKINNPRPNQTIESPIVIEGQARGNWFFEASFPIKLFDANGNQLAVAVAQAQSDWMTTNFVPFKATLEFTAPVTATGTLILQKDNPSGLPEYDNQLRVPVKFGVSTETIQVGSYFNNSNLDPEVSCNKVFPVSRTIINTPAVARAALEELLKGPTDKEKADGFFTSINPGVKIEKLTIENGVAKVEFDEQLEFQVGGSCRVSAIRAQIVETLKQFPTVKDVIISISGRIEDILQP